MLHYYMVWLDTGLLLLVRPSSGFSADCTVSVGALSTALTNRYKAKVESSNSFRTVYAGAISCVELFLIPIFSAHHVLVLKKALDYSSMPPKACMSLPPQWGSCAHLFIVHIKSYLGGKTRKSWFLSYDFRFHSFVRDRRLYISSNTASHGHGEGPINDILLSLD